jgi:hypothetical protein
MHHSNQTLKGIKMKFDLVKFLAGYNIGLRALRESERITKDTLRTMSRDLLACLHISENNAKCGDISFINEVMGVLTPMNRKTFVLFMQEFTGFFYDEKQECFTKKNKGIYNDKCKAAMEFLDDPMNNIWSWAERNVKVEKKLFKLDTVTKDIERAMKATNDDGEKLYNKADIIRAVLAGGITIEEMMEVLN